MIRWLTSTFLSGADGIVTLLEMTLSVCRPLADLAGHVTVDVSSPADLAGNDTVGVSLPADIAGDVTVDVS